MKLDPPVRLDGRCAQCGKKRLGTIPKVATKRSKDELLKQLSVDPFCSSRCCREFHGCALSVDMPERVNGLRDRRNKTFSEAQAERDRNAAAA